MTGEHAITSVLPLFGIQKAIALMRPKYFLLPLLVSTHINTSARHCPREIGLKLGAKKFAARMVSTYTTIGISTEQQ